MTEQEAKARAIKETKYPDPALRHWQNSFKFFEKPMDKGFSVY